MCLESHGTFQTSDTAVKSVLTASVRFIRVTYIKERPSESIKINTAGLGPALLKLLSSHLTEGIAQLWFNTVHVMLQQLKEDV